MSSWASITYTFSASTIARASEVNQNFTDAVSNINKAMPSGGIIMWAYAINLIPSGWYLCDGTNGTPNLVGRFIQGAGAGYAVGTIGGNALSSHSHTYDHVHYDDHCHVGTTDNCSDGSDRNKTDSHTLMNTASRDHNHPFTTVTKSGTGYGGNTASLNATYGYGVTTSDSSNQENRPPFYTLAFIMKS
jgi:hypothetical protein